MFIQGGQHGLPSVWLRLELCDNLDSKDDGGDNHNYDTDHKGLDYDYNNDYNIRNHQDTGDDQQSNKEQEERKEKCPSPRLLMITKIPDFYTTLSNKVGVMVIIENSIIVVNFIIIENFIMIRIILTMLRCGLDVESGGLAEHTGLLLVQRY